VPKRQEGGGLDSRTFTIFGRKEQDGEKKVPRRGEGRRRGSDQKKKTGYLTA